MEHILKISNLSVQVEQKKVIKKLSLCVSNAETHAIMGPNGSGKSSLVFSIIGHPAYTITSGSIFWEEHDISHMPPQDRAKLGLFVAFQYPHEIPGATVFTILKESYYAVTGKLISTHMFQDLLFEKMDELKIDHGFAYRPLNDGFSGGEKKKLEILQLLLLKPRFIILDEIDSGLDIDSMKIVAEAIIRYKKDNPDTAIIIITHHRILLRYIRPDFVHIFQKGTITESGSFALVEKIEREGYPKVDDGS